MIIELRAQQFRTKLSRATFLVFDVFGIDRVVGMAIVDSSRTRDQFQVQCRRGSFKTNVGSALKVKVSELSEILEKQCRF